MRKTLFTAAFLAILVCSEGSSAAGNRSTVRRRIEQLRARGCERVVILLKDDAEIDRQHARFGSLRRLRRMNGLVAEVDRDRIASIRADEAVEAVVIDEPVSLRPPGEAILTGQDALTTGEIVAPARWNNLEEGINSLAALENHGLDGQGLKIAFIDSGINYSLDDIDDNYLGGIDYVGGDSDPFSNNTSEYHACMVVALAAGEGQSRVLGVAPAAGYYLARVTDETFTALISDIVSAMEWAMDPDDDPLTDDGADIISMSLGTYGGGSNWTVLKARWEQLCDEAADEGIVVLSSSGNDGLQTATYPAAFASVISVGAHDQAQNIWNNFVNASNGGVDVVAPGANVISLWPNGGLGTANGTSFAVPHVSALMALQKQYERDNSMTINTAYHRTVLTHSAVDLGESFIWQGYGKAYAAATDANDANDGSLDLMTGRWPVSVETTFAGQVFMAGDKPVYRHGGDIVEQTLTLTNVTDVLGSRIETVQNVVVEVVAVRVDSGQELTPGASIFPPVTWSISPGAANSTAVGATLVVDSDAQLGQYETRVSMAFNFVGSAETIEISYIVSDSQWYLAGPGDLDADGDVDFQDFAIAAAHWGRTECHLDNSCDGADINGDQTVGCGDVAAIAGNWLVGTD